MKENKDMLYFEAILSEKKRIESDIRHRESQIRNITSIIIGFIGASLTLIGFYLSYELKPLFSYLLAIAIFMMVFYLIRLFDLFFAEKKQLKITKKMYRRYIKALDYMNEFDYDASKMKEIYSELRELEIKDIKENKPEYQLAVKLSKRFNIDIHEIEKIANEYVKENEVTEPSFKHYLNLSKIMAGHIEKLRKKE